MSDLVKRLREYVGNAPDYGMLREAAGALEAYEAALKEIGEWQASYYDNRDNQEAETLACVAREALARILVETK